MNGTSYLNNQFLIAMPTLGNPNFFHTVTYICQHNEHGALGIVINRPAEMKLGEIFKQMKIEATHAESNDLPVYAGGPVQPERGFVIHSPGASWDSTLVVSDAIALTTSRDILEALATGRGPDKALVALGYAGWRRRAAGERNQAECLAEHPLRPAHPVRLAAQSTLECGRRTAGHRHQPADRPGRPWLVPIHC